MQDMHGSYYKQGILNRAGQAIFAPRQETQEQ